MEEAVDLGFSKPTSGQYGRKKFFLNNWIELTASARKGVAVIQHTEIVDIYIKEIFRCVMWEHILEMLIIIYFENWLSRQRSRAATLGMYLFCMSLKFDIVV